MAAKVRVYLVFTCAVFFCSSDGFSKKRPLQNGYDVDLKRMLNCFLRGVGCERKEEPRMNQNHKTLIIYLNGIIYTVDHYRDVDWDKHSQEAIVIEDGYIRFVGSDEDAINYIHPGLSMVYDLQGAVVLPGFHDVHMHPLEAMSPLGDDCKFPKVTPLNDTNFIKALNKCKRENSGPTLTGWVLGAGHSITQLINYVKDNNGASPKELLDSYISDKPVAILEETSHSAWVNSKALEMAGIDSNTPERPGGVIMREPNSNTPNGVLFENEAIKIFAIALDATSDKILDSNYDGLLYGLEELAANGITSVCDARVYWKILHHVAWEDACEAGDLSVRAVLGLWAYPSDEDDDDQIETLKKLYSDTSLGCSLRKTQIKVYMDGIVESTTAAMKEPYCKNLSLPTISEKNVGMNYFNKARLTKYLKALQGFDNGKGFDFHIHAIGDKGIRDALDAIEEAQINQPPKRHRHRLTHIELLNETDVNRFKSLGVIADFQVAGTFTLPSHHKTLAGFVGNAKAEYSIPVKDVYETGAWTTLSSDWDVSDLNPFIGIEHATHRGNQSVSVKTAIEMYTINPAFAMRHEDKVGYLRAGMEADLVIIDRDVLSIHTSEIHSTKVLETVFMGKNIHRNPSDIIKNATEYFNGCLNYGHNLKNCYDDWFDYYYYYIY